MNRLVLYLIGAIGSVAIVVGAALLVFVAPINSKNYQDFAPVDYVRLCVTNGAILVAAPGLICIVWRRIIRKSRDEATPAI